VSSDASSILAASTITLYERPPSAAFLLQSRYVSPCDGVFARVRSGEAEVTAARDGAAVVPIKGRRQ